MKQYLLPEGGSFFKVNMHCHTVLSDGAQTPEQIKEYYKEKGYSAVAFTEHEMMLDHSDLTDDGFVAITSYEYGFGMSAENPFPKLYSGGVKHRSHTEKVHLNLYSKDPHDTRMVCYNPVNLWGNSAKFRDTAKYVGEADFKREFTVECMNEVIRAAKERDMLVIYNHPNWSLNTNRLYCALENLDGLEIQNGDAGGDSDMEDVPHVYQEMAREGRRLFCVGGDDNHSFEGSFLAWTMVKAKRLSYEDLIDGLEKGNCYSSSGPEIYELFVEDGRVTVKTSEAVGIYLHTAGRRTDHVSVRRVGRTVREATFALEPTDVMFRIAVRDKDGNHAYTKYYYLDELEEQI